MAIDYDLLKEIKDRADIVDVISYFLPSVQKKGRNYVALCPFHDDSSPSLQINKERQSFMCFVDHTGGDVFTFVQKYEKCTFEEAVRKVCEIINFDDPRLHKKSYAKPIDQNLVPIYNCINELQKFYEYGLSTDEGALARAYLDERKISNDQRQKFGLGYAVQDGKLTISYLQKKGFSLKKIEETGIGVVQTSGMSDNNAGRLIFPIKDQNGQVVGFSARKIVKDENLPKYVNSPETKIFTKGNIIYNLNNAKQTFKHDGYIYLVEGFMDVFALDAIGITSCVALMSTKLTKQHIELLRRMHVEVRVCLDGDRPGQEAMMKIIQQLNEAHLPCRFVSLPGEIRDPDEILKQSGEETLRNFVNSLVEPFDFIINYYQNTSPLGSTEDKKKVVKHFVPMISELKTQFERDNYIYKLESITGFSAQAIRNLVKEYTNNRSETVSNIHIHNEHVLNEHRVSKELRRINKAERMVLEQMFISKDAVKFFEENIKYFYSEDYRIISNFITDFVVNHPDEVIDLSMIMSLISDSDVENKAELNNLISSISFSINETKFNLEALKDCAQIIKEERTRLYEKRTLREAYLGKTTQEQARILRDYVEKTNNVEKEDERKKDKGNAKEE